MNDFTPQAQLGEQGWLEATTQALRHYHSLLTLSHSPLAQPPLIEPTLLLDPLSPSADERGRGLRLLLRWAVATLAPEPPSYPLGSRRPLVDETWRDPRWWGYNILRHRYLEPLHPDQFVPGGRFVETLLSFTGISSRSAYFTVRDRSLREVSGRLREQARSGAAFDAIQRLALADVLGRLEGHPTAWTALQVAATFDGVFTRPWLAQLLAAERLPLAQAQIDFLLEERFLRSDEGGAELWLAPTLRSHVHGQVEPAVRRRRNAAVAALYAAADQPLPAIFHWLAADVPQQAAAHLLEHSRELIADLQHEALIEALTAIPAGLSPPLWHRLQLLLADLYLQRGRLEDARAVCRRALPTAPGAAAEGALYRRLGKLYEADNQLQALAYYRRALERLSPDHAEYVDLLKDRGWLLLLRRDWAAAADDLNRALSLEPGEGQQADLYDALAVLHARRGEHEQAVRLGQQALALREKLGDPGRVARSLHNLALAYDALGRYPEAISAYHEALTFFRRAGDPAALAAVLLSLGATHHVAGHLPDAIRHYHDCLTYCRNAGLPLVQVKAHGNLAEALAELGHAGDACREWENGFKLAQEHAFAEQLGYFRSMQQQFPLLQDAEAAPAPAPVAAGPEPPPLDPVAQRALALAEAHGHLTAGLLQQETDVSKATATRRLGELVDQGRLLRQGKGRGTYYELPDQAAGPGAAPPSPDAALRQQLRQLKPLLEAVYGIKALGLIESDKAGLPRLVVEFDETPSLATFFKLEAFLSEKAGMELDLVPQASAQAAGVTIHRL